MSIMNSRKIIADNLKKLMFKNSQSQGYIHRMTGISQSTVGRILNNEVSPTIDSLDKIANLYNLHSWQLLLPDLDVENPQKLIQQV